MFLEGGVIHTNVILPPLIASLEDCIHACTFTDLSLYLPKGISNTDTQELLENHLLKHIEGFDPQFGGKLIINDNEAVYFSQGMVDEVQKSMLPSLIEAAANVAANQFCIHQKSKHKDDINNKDRPHLFPISSFVEAIMLKYPELSEIPSANNWKHMEWDNSCDDSSHLSESCIVSFCRSFHSKSLEDAFSASVKKSALKLQTSRKMTTLHDMERSEENIEKDFEESFQEACYVLQLLAKLPQHISKSSLVEKCVVKSIHMDYFNGFASVFARLVTEYCFLKHGADIKQFPFITKDGNVNSTAFGTYMNIIVARSFVPTFPLCMADAQNGQQRENELILILNEILPSNAAIAVSKIWQLIDAINHVEGEKELDEVLNNGIDAFLAHAEESCL